MNDRAASALYRRITRLRWQAPLLALLLVLAHQYVEHTWLHTLPRWQHFGSQVLFYGLVGPVLAWWALTSLRRSVLETEKAESALKDAHEKLHKANRRLAFLIRINRQLAEADDEESLLQAILALPQEVVAAAAVSLVRFDEREQTLPPLFSGELDEESVTALALSLTDEQVRKQCAACVDHAADAGASCRLLQSVTNAAHVQHVHCLPLARSDRRYGILNIYLQERPAPSEQSLLKAMAHEISLALESHSLRARELKMLSQLQQTHWWSTLEEDLAGVLERTVEALEADGGAFFIDRIKPMAPQITAKAGLPLGENEGLVRGLIDSTRETGKPLMIKELEPEAGAAVTSLLAIPLQADEQVLGHLALWSVQAGAFGRRHAHLASIVAGQAALLVENQRLSLQVKHQAAYAERARLAREIHDGLAQSLATLKLRTAQMASWWQQGDGPRLAQGLEEVQRLLNEAYVDAREAIDGLHLAAEDAAMEQWMEELALDFETLSGVPVQVRPQATVRLAPDARAQLQRIVQEALSNVRKHARASHVHIAWQEQDGQLLLQIEDDGCGFEPDSVSGARHGLRTMRERAQLLGAMFKVTSQPGKGTSIELRLPLPEKVKHEHTD